MDEIDLISSRGGVSTGVPTGFADLDGLTNGLHPGQMVIIAARPALGKSTLALDLARAASIKGGETSVIFSLEMSRTEITMRLLSAEAKVPLHHMRSGRMGDEDWARLARRMGEVAEAPLYIDDSPNLTLMEIRAKSRRLRQRHNLKLVVVDYLQLMASPRRVENRQQEVSEFSRALKLLAKELEVPVVALSQLNRGPEQRQDKKPMLSDLRESGCLTAETRILRADTGAEVALGELLAGGARNIPVWSLDDRLKLVPRTMTHVFPSGTRDVYRMRLASGREITATANHPFLSHEGWQPLGSLDPGDRVGVLRYLPAPLKGQARPDSDVTLLANAVLGGQRGHQKFVPAAVFGLADSQVRSFIRQLWAAGGSVRCAAAPAPGGLCYASASRRLADDLARLLLRFNLLPTIERVRRAGGPDRYHLHLCGAEQQLRFIDEIGIPGASGDRAVDIAACLREIRLDTNPDAVPTDVWDRVRSVLTEPQMTHRELVTAPGAALGGGSLRERAPSRTRLARVAALLDAAELEMLATNDVCWDTVTSIDSLGEREVYDATVLGTHNFVADGIAVHNSLEQDADMVILLHREDAYERESPRAGEADLILAKNRNGPTGTVTVAFQGHYSRFVDMQQGG
jgi:replicative DNA helicase